MQLIPITGMQLDEFNLNSIGVNDDRNKRANYDDDDDGVDDTTTTTTIM